MLAGNTIVRLLDLGRRACSFIANPEIKKEPVLSEKELECKENSEILHIMVTIGIIILLYAIIRAL